MINLVTFVGRINYIYTEDNILEIKGTKIIYKDEIKVGEEEVYIPVIVGDSMMKHIQQYCNIDDVVGVKGWLKNRDGKLIVMADKLTFLTASNDIINEGGEVNDSE
jgi:hypothetical protein